MKKTRTTIAVLLASATLASANLIDRTPGGYNYNDPLPPAVLEFFNAYQNGLENIAGALIDNNVVTWSPFTIFGDDFFNITANGTTASVSWDLANSQTSYFVSYVLIETRDNIIHLYSVPFPDWFAGGPFIVTADNFVNVTSITFAGFNTVPDDLSTVFAFLIPLAVLAWVSLIPKYHNP